MELLRLRFGPWLAIWSKTSTFRFYHLTLLNSNVMHINRKDIKNAQDRVHQVHQVCTEWHQVQKVRFSL